MDARGREHDKAIESYQKMRAKLDPEETRECWLAYRQLLDSEFYMGKAQAHHEAGDGHKVIDKLSGEQRKQARRDFMNRCVVVNRRDPATPDPRQGTLLGYGMFGASNRDRRKAREEQRKAERAQRRAQREEQIGQEMDRANDEWRAKWRQIVDEARASGVSEQEIVDRRQRVREYLVVHGREAGSAPQGRAAIMMERYMANAERIARGLEPLRGPLDPHRSLTDAHRPIRGAQRYIRPRGRTY
jgi:hypothetical protein